MVLYIILLIFFCASINIVLPTNVYELQLPTVNSQPLANSQPYIQKPNIGIRATVVTPQSVSNYQPSNSSQLQSFESKTDKQELFSNYPMYSSQDYLNYIRTIPGYEESIILLQKKIRNDKKFKEQTANMPGFSYSFNFWSKEKSGFHDFINEETNRIVTAQNSVREQEAAKIKLHNEQIQKRAQERRKEEDQRLELLGKEFAVQACATSQHNVTERLNARIKAIDLMRKQPGICFDYSSQVSNFGPNDTYAVVFSHTYGTPLDCQLHKELYQTRNMMMQLEHDFSQRHHVQIIAPAVHQLAAQAKEEVQPDIAFKLSDFCYAVTQVACSLGKGVWNGTMTFASPEHWKEMVTGTLHLAFLFADAVGQENARDNALYLSVFANDQNIYTNQAKEFCLHTQAQEVALNQFMHKTYKKLAAMPWQRRAEKFAELGTTMILDILAFNALNGFSRAAGRAAVAELNRAMENGLLLTKEYAVEIAGFGKVIVEEGAEVAGKAAEIIAHNPGIAVANDGAIGTMRAVRKIQQKPHWESLAIDPDHGNKISLKSIEEALAGIAAEEKGFLPGPIKRDPTGAAEFIDILGVAWDVKTPISLAPNGKHIFKIDQVFSSIKRELGLGENVILNMIRLDRNDALSLIAKLKAELSPLEMKKIITVFKEDLF